MTLVEDGTEFEFVATDCPVCGSDSAGSWRRIDRYPQGRLTFVRCLGCGAAYQNPRPTTDSLRAFYHSAAFFRAGKHFVGYRDYDEEALLRDLNARRRLREIQDLVPGRLRMLDVACGHASFVRQAVDLGHDASGIDYSAKMVRGAELANRVQLIHADFLGHDFGTQRFNVVTLYGAVQNFANLIELTAKVRSILAPGGLYCVNFIALGGILERLQGDRFWIYRPPVVFVPTVEGFVRHHEDRGFRLVRKRIETQSITLGKLATYVFARPMKVPLDRMVLRLPASGYWRTIFCLR